MQTLIWFSDLVVTSLCYNAQTGGTAYSNSHIPDIFKVRQDRPGQICNLTPLFSFQMSRPYLYKVNGHLGIPRQK